jgi:hypothetical protein
MLGTATPAPADAGLNPYSKGLIIVKGEKLSADQN